MLTYTDADGGVTRSEFDRYGKPSKVSDNTGSTTYGYDRVAEPRGMLTSVADSIAGTFTAKYSPDGQLVEMKYPGGMTRTDTLDATFAPVGRVYKREADGQVIYSESVVENTQGQQVNHAYTGGSKTYGYDTLGRLTSVKQVTETACTTRAYAYDNRTNRTAKRTYNPATGGGCRTDGNADAEDGHSYDTADRITDTGLRLRRVRPHHRRAGRADQQLLRQRPRRRAADRRHQAELDARPGAPVPWVHHREVGQRRVGQRHLQAQPLRRRLRRGPLDRRGHHPRVDHPQRVRTRRRPGRDHVEDR